MDIKNYHLGEIGVFLRAAVNAKKADMDERLWISWYGPHADQTDIEKLSKSFKNKNKGKRKGKPAMSDKQKINDNWKALKGFIGGIR